MKKSFFIALACILGLASTAMAVTSAHPGGFVEPVTSIADKVTSTYNFIFWITAVIFVFVQAVLLICIWKFRRSRRKKAATFTHNNLLEFAWTIVPAIICVAIAWKAFDAMLYIRTMPEKGMNVDVIAYQFGWDFDYTDLGISSPLNEEPHAEISSAGVERFVKEMVVPIHTNIKLQVTASDVIHSFYTPALGVKIDAMPGRINYQWFNAHKEGEYVGQCAELCGSAHGEMFFVVKVVSQDDFYNWVNDQRAEAGLERMDHTEIQKLLNS